MLRLYERGGAYRSKKWGIELLRDGDRLAAHNDRFTQGEYAKWIQEENMHDHIMIDVRSNVPTDRRGTRILIITMRIADFVNEQVSVCEDKTESQAVQKATGLYTKVG